MSSFIHCFISTVASEEYSAFKLHSNDGGKSATESLAHVSFIKWCARRLLTRDRYDKSHLYRPLNYVFKCCIRAHSTIDLNIIQLLLVLNVAVQCNSRKRNISSADLAEDESYFH